jgi:hypothetical protein
MEVILFYDETDVAVADAYIENSIEIIRGANLLIEKNVMYRT